MNSAIDYFNNHKDAFTHDLIDCLKIPSISTLEAYNDAIKDCATHLEEHLSFIGLQNIKRFNEYGNPILYAETMQVQGRPTLLCYGHYDVQPVDPIDLWSSPPFEPNIKDGYIFARGASDNKGMFYSQLKAAESFIKSNTALPVNIKFIIEGEEEIGSHGLTKFIQDHQDLLDHDAVLVSDNPMFSESQPSVCTSIRGLIYMECRIQSMNHDVHSGQLGGGVPNVIHYISDCIRSLKDPKTNKVLVPGFYDDVLTKDSFDATDSIVKDHLLNLDHFFNLGTHANDDFYTNIWNLPTLDCNGIKSGFVDEGAKTVIPCDGFFKVSCRLVDQQCPDRIFNLVKNHIIQSFPDSFNITVTSIGPHARSMSVEKTDPYVQKAVNALLETHNKPPFVHGEGGSIPILADFQSLFKKPVVLIGLNSPNDNIHAPNERFKIDHFFKGIETYIRYFSSF